MKPTQALSQIRVLLPELVSWRENRVAKHLDTGTLDRTIALLAEIQKGIEGELHAINE